MREWKPGYPKPGAFPDAITMSGIRTDGQCYIVTLSTLDRDMEKVKAEAARWMESFLNERCNCVWPETGLDCPVHQGWAKQVMEALDGKEV